MAENFEPLEINLSYIPPLKVLGCGINASSFQCCGCSFILSYTHLNLPLLLHKQRLVAPGVGTTVVLFLRANREGFKMPASINSTYVCRGPGFESWPCLRQIVNFFMKNLLYFSKVLLSVVYKNQS